MIAVFASPNQGYRFNSWTGSGAGSFSGASASFSLTVSSSIKESATFDAEVHIQSSGAGWVAYAYDSVSATAHGTGTIYLPLGSLLRLSALPSSPFYSFSGWSGASNSTSPSIVLTINQPSSVTASFKCNYFDISAVVAGIVAIAIILFFLLRRISK